MPNTDTPITDAMIEAGVSCVCGLDHTFGKTRDQQVSFGVLSKDVATLYRAMQAAQPRSAPREELVIGALAANLDLSVDLLIELQASGNLQETARAIIAAIQTIPAKQEGE